MAHRLGAAAVAVAVGRILPSFSSGARWPLKLLGLGYAVLAIVILVIGVSSPLVMWLTAGGIALALATLIVVVAAF